MLCWRQVNGHGRGISLIGFTHQTEANQRGHVAGRSRASDRPGKRLRSDVSRSFCKKSVRTLAKSTRSPTFSQFLIKKTLELFKKSTCNPCISMGRPASRMGRAHRRVASNGPKMAHKSLFVLYSLIFSF
jgi:hypothetical protein